MPFCNVKVSFEEYFCLLYNLLLATEPKSNFVPLELLFTFHIFFRVTLGGFQVVPKMRLLIRGLALLAVASAAAAVPANSRGETGHKSRQGNPSPCPRTDPVDLTAMLSWP